MHNFIRTVTNFGPDIILYYLPDKIHIMHKKVDKGGVLVHKDKAFWGSIAGFFIVCIAGTVCHYVYQLTGKNIIAGMLTPVNESVWEHLKLLYFPYIIYTLTEYFIYGRKIKGFLFSRVFGVICGMIFIPLMFFLYTSLTGKSFVFIDIMLFIISVIISFAVSLDRIVKERDAFSKRSFAAVVIIISVSLLFFGLTFYPPSTRLFSVPK